MRDSRGCSPPDRQRRFDRAFHAIDLLYAGRAGRRPDWLEVHWGEIDPTKIERVRWLLIALARARATLGSAAIARLICGHVERRPTRCARAGWRSVARRRQRGRLERHASSRAL